MGLRFSFRSIGLALPVLLVPVMVAMMAEAQQHAVPQRSASPPSLDHLLKEAQAAQSNSQFAAAAAFYAGATKLRPQLAELWANRGLMEHLAARPDAALVSFAHALELKPSLFTPLLFSAEDEITLKRPKVALPFLDRAARLQPENPDVSLTFARAYSALGDSGQAAASYQRATDLRPGDPAAWYGLAVASLEEIEAQGAALARTHAASSWAGALYAEELLAQGRLTEGTNLYAEAARKTSPEQRCKLRRELEVSETNEISSLPEAARSALESALKETSSGLASINSGSCACTSEASKTPACAYFAGQYAMSASLAAASTSTSLAEPEALFWSIKSNERRAVLALSRFEELSPQSPMTLDLTGDLYRRRALPERARAEYTRALALDPHDPGALLGMAAAHLAEGHTDQAIEYARQGLADRPEDPKLNVALAEALVSAHRYEEAAPYLQTSLKHRDDSAAFAHALLGRIAAAKEDIPTAIGELRLGLPTDRDGSLHYQLYRVLRKSGDLDGAKLAEAEARALVARRLTSAETALQNAQEAQPN